MKRKSDFQTRFYKDRPEEVEKFRKNAEDFVDMSLATDACLIFAPSQVQQLKSSTCLHKKYAESHVKKN